MADKNIQVDKDIQDFFLKSPLGPKVLGKLLDDCGFLDIAQDENNQVEQNNMKLILSWAGIGFGLTGEQYVRALMSKKREIIEEDEES